MGASVKGCVLGVPVFVIFPKSAFKLVLDVEHPDTNGGGDNQNGHMNKKKSPGSDGVKKDDNKAGNGQIGSHGTDPGFDFFHATQGKTVTENKQISGPE